MKRAKQTNDLYIIVGEDGERRNADQNEFDMNDP